MVSIDGAASVATAADSILPSCTKLKEVSILNWRRHPRQVHCCEVTSRAQPQPGGEPIAAEALPIVLRPAREPDFHQDRARRSYVALLDAATALFSARGYDAVGTPEIAHRAGVSVGSFYRYFDDKHEIYLEIARRTMIAAYS